VFKTAVVFLCKERLRPKKKSIIGGSSKSSAAEVEIIRYQVLIPVTEVQVRAGTVKDVESHYLWELIHLKSQVQRRNEKIYHLSNSTSEFRNAFLKTIRQIIRESVRNMSIPPCDMVGGGRKPEPPLRSESTKLSIHGHIGVSENGGSNGNHITAQTLQLNRKKTSNGPKMISYNSLQRHSSHEQRVGGGHNDYDNVEGCGPSSRNSALQSGMDVHRIIRNRTLGDGLDELADLAINSESDSIRDECSSSGVRSEAEEESAGDSSARDRDPRPQDLRKMVLPPTNRLSSGPGNLSMSTTSSLSSTSTTSQPRLVQSSLREPVNITGPPAPPPRSSSAMAHEPLGANSVNNTAIGGHQLSHSSTSDLGSPIWKPREGGGSLPPDFPPFSSGSEPTKTQTRSREEREEGCPVPRARSRAGGGSERPSSRADSGASAMRHTIGFDPSSSQTNHLHSKKENLQSACKRK